MDCASPVTWRSCKRHRSPNDRRPTRCRPPRIGAGGPFDRDLRCRCALREPWRCGSEKARKNRGSQKYGLLGQACRRRPRRVYPSPFPEKGGLYSLNRVPGVGEGVPFTWTRGRLALGFLCQALFNDTAWGSLAGRRATSSTLAKSVPRLMGTAVTSKPRASRRASQDARGRQCNRWRRAPRRDVMTTSTRRVT